MNPKLKIIISMLAFGTVGLFIKNIDLASAEIALYRAVIASTVIFAYIVLAKKQINYANLKKQLLKLFISGAAIGFNWIFLFEAYRYTSIALATLCYYFAPVIVIVMSGVIYKEKLTLKQIICFIGATVGVLFIIGSVEEGSGSTMGIIFGLGAACLYAFVVLMNKSIRGIGGEEQTLMQFLSASLVLTPYVLANTGFNISSLNSFGLINVCVLGIVHTGIMYVLYFSSMHSLSGQTLSMLSYIDPLTAVIISLLILHEPVTAFQMAGGACILLFTLANEFSFGKKKIRLR